MLRDFDFRSNSIGFLRFCFASVVIWSHAYPLGGFGLDPVSRFSNGAESAGTLAVDGFFLLSGFLITRSYQSIGKAGRFLWHRALRILPAFWVCLFVVAFGFAPLAYFHQHGALIGFIPEEKPWNYVTHNSLLWMRQYNVGELLAHAPYPRAFNGSLWTLPFEFLCYLTIGLLGLIGILRQKPVVVASVSLMLFLCYAVPLSFRGVLHGPLAFPILLVGNTRLVLELIVYFFIGASSYLFRGKIPIVGWAALVCAIGVIVALPTRAYAAVLPLGMTYVIMYVAMKWPPRSFDRRADLSYGLYIYAFPTQQLLTLYGVGGLGLIPYVLVTAVITFTLAGASWFFIEKPSLSLKHVVFALPRMRST
jgi:peptidoglycan/LPS O-acetylase OafA/YrhL